MDVVNFEPLEDDTNSLQPERRLEQLRHLMDGVRETVEVRVGEGQDVTRCTPVPFFNTAAALFVARTVSMKTSRLG